MVLPPYHLCLLIPSHRDVQSWGELSLTKHTIQLLLYSQGHGPAKVHKLYLLISRLFTSIQQLLYLLWV